MGLRDISRYPPDRRAGGPPVRHFARGDTPSLPHRPPTTGRPSKPRSTGDRFDRSVECRCIIGEGPESEKIGRGRRLTIEATMQL
jgi:hypothetical protein